MRAKRLGVALTVAAAFVVGCLDSGGGNQDQWMNTDAYVAPEVGTTSGEDGGVDVATCSDAPAFGTPTRLGEDLEYDGGAHVQFGVVMAGSSSDAGTAVNVVWLDRDTSTPAAADLRAAQVPAGASAGTIVELPRPTDCQLLMQPALTVTAAGTVVVAATCLVGTELSPTETRILLFRSSDGLQTIADANPTPVVSCTSTTRICGYPSVAATAAGVYVAWTDWTIVDGNTTAVVAKVWRSDDDGVTLAEEILLPDTFVQSGVPRLAADPNGGVHLAFNGAFSLGGTSYTGYSKLAGGTAFATPEVLGPADGPPHLAAGTDAVYVVWPGGDGSVLDEAHSTGAAFTAARSLAQPEGTTTVMSPAVAVDPAGAAHLFWQAASASGWSAYYSVSTDQGAAWSEPVLVAGPFDGSAVVGGFTQHQLGDGDVVAGADGVTVGWGDPMSTDPMSGVTNVYLARRVCP